MEPERRQPRERDREKTNREGRKVNTETGVYMLLKIYTYTCTDIPVYTY